MSEERTTGTTAPQSLAVTECARCGENLATKKWLGDSGALGLVHGGGADWCERCVVEEQTKHARGRAAALPDLERQLAKLGGPATAVCSCIPALLAVQECDVHGTVDYEARYRELGARSVPQTSECHSTRVPKDGVSP